MPEPLVSIIIPIYKVEPYLRQCLDSVINQTYTNLEIILVDDGSPDNSPQICDEYATKDNRIVVIHKENGGLSDARNVGLDICKGEYISFVDSDDWVENAYIKVLYEILKKENADISICTYNSFIDGSAPTPIHPSNQQKSFLWDSHETLIRLCKEETVGLIAAWGKLYKRQLFEYIRFPKGKLYEDAYVNYKLYSQCEKICYTSTPLYYYRIRNGSIMANTKGLIYDLDAREERYVFLTKHNEPAAQYCLERLCWDYLIISIQPHTFFDSNNYLTSSQDAQKKFREYATLFLETDKGNFIHRILIKAFVLFPRLYSLLYKASPWHLRKAI